METETRNSWRLYDAPLAGTALRPLTEETLDAQLTAEERQQALASLKAPDGMSGALDAAVQRIREKAGPQEPASRIRLR